MLQDLIHRFVVSEILTVWCSVPVSPQEKPDPTPKRLLCEHSCSLFVYRTHLTLANTWILALTAQCLLLEKLWDFVMWGATGKI